MTLLNAKHLDEATAALSVASIRAEKIRKLRRAGHDSIAQGYWSSLHRDIAEFITTRDAPDGLAQRLLEIRDGAS